MGIDTSLLLIHHFDLPVKLFDLQLEDREILDAALLPFQHFRFLIIDLTEHPLLVATLRVLLNDGGV